MPCVFIKAEGGFTMNTTDQAELELTESIEREMATGYNECPYCDGKITVGKCEGCGWEAMMEYPPMEDE